MVFKYDMNRLNDYKKRSFYLALIICSFILIAYLFMIRGIMGSWNDIFIVFVSIIVLIIAAGIGIFIGIKNLKIGFEYFQMECNEQEIIIKNKSLSKTIKIEKIKKILKDRNNNFYLYTDNINNIKILNYISNIDELEKYLSGITNIEQFRIKNKILEYDLVCFLMIFVLSLIFFGIGYTNLFFIFFAILLLSLIYFAIKYIIQWGFKYKIIGLIILGYIIFTVIRRLYPLIIVLIK